MTRRTAPDDSFDPAQTVLANQSDLLCGVVTVRDVGQTLTSSVRLGDAPASDKMTFVYDLAASKP